MKKRLIQLMVVFILGMPLYAMADDLTVKLVSADPDEIHLEISFSFNNPEVIYHWGAGDSIYPIINHGLFIECRDINSNQNISFIPYEKVLPKLPHELDVLKVREYKEVLKIVPGENYNTSSLKKGKYSLKIIYNTKELQKHPGGKELSVMNIESNEIVFEIN